MDWFEEWFDSPLYEKLYANRDEEEAARLVELLDMELPLEKGAEILDLGCGRGRHAINLNKKGYNITGIDLSKEAIATAREKADQMGLSGIRFEVRDMRNPLPKTFDAIVNLFTTFGYFKSDEENASVLDSVQKMLRPGGFFVLDYLNARKVEQDHSKHDEGEFQGIHYDIKRHIDNNAIIKEIEFSGTKIDGTKRYAERVKLYGLPWFEKQMAKRNMEIDRVYGNYRGDDFDPDTSPRLLIISHLKADGK